MTARWDLSCTNERCCHRSRENGHCQEPDCPAYIQKCPQHQTQHPR